MQSVFKTLIQLYTSQDRLNCASKSHDRCFFDLFLKIPQLHPTIPVFIFTISVLVMSIPQMKPTASFLPQLLRTGCYTADFYTFELYFHS